MYKIIRRDKDLVQIENTSSNETYIMKLIYDHKELGKFYAFGSIFSMPFQRKAIFDLIRQHEIIGTDKKELIASNEEIMKLLVEKPTGWEHDAYTKIFNINSTLKTAWDYYKTASAIVPLIVVPEADLENIGIYEQDKQETYITTWSKDSTMFAFFLSIVQRKMNNFYNQYNPASQDYLDKVSQLTESQVPTTSDAKPIKNTKNFKNLYFWLQRKAIQSVIG